MKYYLNIINMYTTCFIYLLTHKATIAQQSSQIHLMTA